MWPLLDKAPVCVMESEASKAKTWTANISDEKLDYTVEMRKALVESAWAVTHSKMDYAGLWIFCDEIGTWVVLTYTKAKISSDAARNLKQIFKVWGEAVLAKIEMTRNYFNESHQARLQKFKIRKELIYQAQAESAQTLIKPKGRPYTVTEYVAYAAGQSMILASPVSAEPQEAGQNHLEELALASPMPSTLLPLAPYESTITSLMHEAEQINVSIKELTDAREQCIVERAALTNFPFFSVFFTQQVICRFRL